MTISRRILVACLALLILFAAMAIQDIQANAQSASRQQTIVVAYTEYEWWLIRWTDNQILCRLKVDHEGLPTTDEVFAACGTDISQLWQSTPPCKVIKDGKKTTTVCAGLYLHLVASTPREREVVIDLPTPIVWVNLEGCTPQPPENRCNEIPSLQLTAEEPLPNERITSIEGFINGEPFLCESALCTIPLRTTGMEGLKVEFWANSSYGDESDTFTAQVRVIDTGVSDVPGGDGWYVDVISTQWRGADIASCARTWDSFPSVGAPPPWLSTPDHFNLLASDNPYYYLAGRLIAQGLVDAANCTSGGLLPNGYADACGLEQAQPMVEEWQNLFDDRIIEVAKASGVPAQLMKNLFAQESQFWPGVFRVKNEFGLGQLTDNGVDSILLWNPSFYAQFCPLVLAQDACAGGYLSLSSDNQAILRGALAVEARSDCPECPTGIDLTNVDFSVSLFADTLEANCQQISQLIYTATESVPGEVSSYEDLWRLTVANYHAGPGCVSYAIHNAWQRTGELTWDQVSNYFTEPCQGVIPYVNQITR
jgi:hypothetical protein